MEHTEWFCQQCKIEGRVNHVADAGIRVGWLIKAQHDKLVQADHLGCIFDLGQILTRTEEAKHV